MEPASPTSSLWSVTLDVHALDARPLADALEQAAQPEALSVSMTRLGPNDGAALDGDETDPELGGLWRIEALYEMEPLAEELGHLLSGFKAATHWIVAPLEDRDWVSYSQQGFAPVRAGRFAVADPDHWSEVAELPFALRVTPGAGFGTGHHGSTAGCLLALDRLARRFGGHGYRPHRLLDLGCGSGILAVAAARLWRRPVLASDIDGPSLEAARDTVAFNGAGPYVRLVRAAGFNHLRLRAGRPYDLICANILARPLIGLAAAFRRHMAPGGYLILSGLIREQEAKIAHVFSSFGFSRFDRVEVQDWITLVLRL